MTDTLAGTDLVPTGIVTVCCGLHITGDWFACCTRDEDCMPCCERCPTCPGLPTAWPDRMWEWGAAAAAATRAIQNLLLRDPIGSQP